MHPTSDNGDNSRKSPRAKFHDYSGGTYFVTICTLEKQHFFGKIKNEEMNLSLIGKYCEEQLKTIDQHYPYARTLMYVIMPNHIHAIISIVRDQGNNESHRMHEPSMTVTRTALSVVIGRLKRAVTMYARRNNFDFGWQSRYHDHIIRDNRDGNNIARYIETNVIRWDTDCFNTSLP